jgi:alanine dehydrogenase
MPLKMDFGEVVAKKIEVRKSAEDIILFDSTGTAFQEAALASTFYEKALSLGKGQPFSFLIKLMSFI